MDYEIRAIRREDMEGFNALRRMRGVFENTLGIPSERLERNLDGYDSFGSGDHLFAAVTKLADGKELVIGVAGLTVRTNPRTRHVGSIGIFVHRDYQSQGIGTALLRTLLDLADNWLMLVRVELEVFAENEGAIRLYERLGFHKEGLRQKATVRNGVYADEYMMARFLPTLGI